MGGPRAPAVPAQGTVIGLRSQHTGGVLRVTVHGPGYCHKPGTIVGCHRPILWCVTERGRMMPVDPDPDAEGLYTSHFATCRDAGKFRRRRR